MLVKSVTEDKVLAEIEHYRPRVLKTSLSNEDEAKLKAALNKVRDITHGSWATNRSWSSISQGWSITRSRLKSLSREPVRVVRLHGQSSQSR